MTFPDLDLTYIEFTFLIKLPYQICRLARVHWTGKKCLFEQLTSIIFIHNSQVNKTKCKSRKLDTCKNNIGTKDYRFLLHLKSVYFKRKYRKKGILNTNKYLKEMRVHLVGLFWSKPHKMFVLGLPVCMMYSITTCLALIMVVDFLIPLSFYGLNKKGKRLLQILF